MLLQKTQVKQIKSFYEETKGKVTEKITIPHYTETILGLINPQARFPTIPQT